MTAFAQGNLGFLADTPVAHFTPRDWELMKSAVTEVLDGAGEPREKDWENRETGSRGKVVLVESFRAGDGRDCRVLRVWASADGRENVARHTLCRDTKQGWRLDPDASARVAPR